MEILGVRIDNISKEELFSKINSFLNDGRFHQIATVNPEFILTAQKDKEFRDMLNQCDLNVADGIGLKFATWKMGEKLKMRIAGVDLMEELLKIANDKKLKVFLCARQGGLSSWQETRDSILKKYPELEISGDDIDVQNNPAKLPPGNFQIILCNLGAPYQERFLQSLKNDIMGIAVGVGGSFDFITGKLRRAPRWMRSIGFEWFWRLILQPKRIHRIWNAVIIFPIKIIFSRN